MEINEFQVITNAKGEITCGDIGITSAEWLDLIKRPEASRYLDALFCILRMPKHKASCNMLHATYGQQPQHYNAKILSFSKWVQNTLNRFKIVRPGRENCYWVIPMAKGITEKAGFMWYLREELTEALQQLLIENLIEGFQKECQVKSLIDYDETYKWELINKDRNASTSDIIRSLKGVNIVSNMHVDGIFKNLLESRPEEFIACVDRLFDENHSLDSRLSTFKTDMKNLAHPDSKIFANDERTAAALLTCKYPEKYTVYMDMLYRLICSYLGIEVRKPGKKYSHYMDIITGIANRYDEQIQSIIENDISQFELKPSLLATQTVFWCMQDEIRKTIRNSKREIWMVGCYIEEDLTQKFKDDNSWKGQFNDDSDSDQDLLMLATTFKKDDIIVLKSTGTKGVNHDQSFLRIKAVGIITGDVVFSRIDGAMIGVCPVTYLNTGEIDFQGSYYGNYSKSINPLNPKHKEILNYINSLLNKESMDTSQYGQYIQLLKANKNLVLTGAPGTGKTHMAQAIAESMKAVTTLVQFHPSYDYTDFVEGLRPVQDQNSGQIGFERKDGVFKSFCKKAVHNLIDSQKTLEKLRIERSWVERLNSFISDAIENHAVFQLTTGNQFSIVDFNENNIFIYNQNNPKTPNFSVSIEEILDLLNNEVILTSVGDIRTHYQHKYRTQSDSYVFVIINQLRKLYVEIPETETQPMERKDFVFIIDEINRGEASKIFGELFYAIDPGYRKSLLDIERNEKQNVQTQYQNLVPETDVFAKGFYVPENVYILATMNDIDRSVESMDFAMRRRFTWKEVLPTDTEYMLEENLDKEVLSDAIERLHRLNAAISQVEELGAAYMIGPSYFLKLKDHNNSFDELWTLNLEPLLKEYLRGIRKANKLLIDFHKAYLEENFEEQDAD